jgi:virginiamycin B lyase
MMERNLAPRVLPALIALALLSACGGDDNGGPAPATSTIPVATLTPVAPSAATPDDAQRTFVMQEFTIPPGKGAHDVAPAPDGTVWYTAQASGELGILDPATGATEHVALGPGSAPHGVIAGPDGAAWITDGGLNAIVRVDAATRDVRVFPLPSERAGAGVHTPAFAPSGILWFTGQSGVYGRLDPSTGDLQVYDAPMGRGPYGITVTPRGDVYFASLAASYIARVDPETGEATVMTPPTAGQGARRVWSDSLGRIWVSEWNAGQVAVYDPDRDSWREWRLPGDAPQAYAVFVDDQEDVWLSDFGSNAMVRFDPDTESFETFAFSQTANIRQIAGREGEVWGAESAADRLVVFRAR